MSGTGRSRSSWTVAIKRVSPKDSSPRRPSVTPSVRSSSASPGRSVTSSFSSATSSKAPRIIPDRPTFSTFRRARRAAASGWPATHMVTRTTSRIVEPDPNAAHRAVAIGAVAQQAFVDGAEYLARAGFADRGAPGRVPREARHAGRVRALAGDVADEDRPHSARELEDVVEVPADLQALADGMVGSADLEPRDLRDLGRDQGSAGGRCASTRSRSSGGARFLARAEQLLLVLATIGRVGERRADDRRAAALLGPKHGADRSRTGASRPSGGARRRSHGPRAASGAAARSGSRSRSGRRERGGRRSGVRSGRVVGTRAIERGCGSCGRSFRRRAWRWRRTARPRRARRRRLSMQVSTGGGASRGSSSCMRLARPSEERADRGDRLLRRAEVRAVTRSRGAGRACRRRAGRGRTLRPRRGRSRRPSTGGPARGCSPSTGPRGCPRGT